MSEEKIKELVMSIVPPYVTRVKETVFEIIKDRTDIVERSGYVSPDKKIESFIMNGELIQNYRGNSEEFDVQGGETEADSDSLEYRDELTQDAENYDGKVLPQFIDTISACEQLENIEKNFNASELANDEDVKSKKEARKKQKEFIDDLSTALSETMKKNEVRIEKD